MLTVLIGAPGAGKSTVGATLAQRTGRVFIDADAVATASYARVGWSVDRLRRRARDVGFEAAHAEWEPALAAAVVDLVAGHPAVVLALGAGHSHLTDAELFEAVAVALRAAQQVILLRPHPEVPPSLDTLRRRCVVDKGHDWQIEGVDWLRRWLTDGCDEQLATSTVYTRNLSVDDTAIAVQATPHR